MSPGLAIVLIIVVWLLVLAPVLLRSQRPMSRTGEAFDDTRVLFEGDSGELEPNRGPRLSAKTARIKARKKAQENSDNADNETDADSITADATAAIAPETETADQAEKQTVASAAARIKSEYDTVNADEQDAESAETIDGEVVYEVEAADANTSDKDASLDDDHVVDAEFVDVDEVTDAPADKQQAAAHPVTAELSDEDLNALEDDDDILLEDEPRSKKSDEDETAGVSASESQVFTAPAAYELADDAYELDETYVSPVDLMYPGAVDPALAEDKEEVSTADTSPADASAADASAAETDAAEDTEGSDSDAAEASTEVAEYDEEFEPTEIDAESDTELSDEELEFAQSRVGRGGWDPEADAANKATRYQRRQRTLLGLALVVVLTVALGIIFGGWLWWTAAIAGGLTIAYLVALRTQVRQEQQLRARRIAQLRRARLGVRSAQDEELAIPRSLRRPGAVIVEIDDNSPDWDHLPEMYEEADDAPERPAPRRQRRDDLAIRRVG